MSKQIEIERRFLIKESIEKELNEFPSHKVLNIKQYYLYSGERLRQIKDLSNKSHIKYTKTIKRKINNVLAEEDESFITKEEFFNEMDRFESCLVKDREVFLIDGLKYELDTYRSPHFKFKILEIEFASMSDYEASFKPNFLNKIFEQNLICEITGQDEFSNYNLSLAKQYV